MRDVSRRKRAADGGTFAREVMPWIPDNWDSGYVDSRGRFRVYSPECPRAYSDGWALRAHVVWWMFSGSAHPRGTELHHKDENRLNDRIENLEMLTNSEHQRRHKPLNLILLVCPYCRCEFSRHKSRVRYAKTYCSHDCYSRAERSQETRAKMSAGLRKAHQEKPNWRAY